MGRRGYRINYNTWTPFLLAGIFLAEGIALTFLGITNDDEGVVLSAARLLRQGKIPFIDFALSKQPLNLIYYAIWPSIVPARLMNVAIGTVATFIIARKFGWWASIACFPYFVQFTMQARGEVPTYLFSALIVTGASRWLVIPAMWNRISAVPILLYLFLKKDHMKIAVVGAGLVILLLLSTVWAQGFLYDQILYNAKANRGMIVFILYFYPLWPLLLEPVRSMQTRYSLRASIFAYSIMIGLWTINMGYIQPGNVGTIKQAAAAVEAPLFTYQNLINVESNIPLITDRLVMGRFSITIPNDPRWMNPKDDQEYINQANSVAGYDYELRRWDLSDFELVTTIEKYGQPKREMFIYRRK